MSFYSYLGYELMMPSLGLAIQRTPAFEVNIRQIGDPPAFPPPAALPTPLANRTSDLSRYPIYGSQPQYSAHIATMSQFIPQRVPNQHEVTSAHPNFRFDTSDLPALLFRIDPVVDTVYRFAPPMLVDAATGLLVVNSRGAQLRYFSFLPRYVSQNVSGALLEYWFRLDYNLKYEDIVDRMEASPGHPLPAPLNLKNRLNMKRLRFRENLALKAWEWSKPRPTRSELEAIDSLTSIQICFNTSMKVDWTNQRMLKPVFNDQNCTAAGQIGWVDAGVPMDFFLQNSAVAIPSKRMIACVYLRQRLQELALRIGVGSGTQEDWRHLNTPDEPVWWSNGGPNVGRRIWELAGNYRHEESIDNAFGRLSAVITRR